MTAHAIPKGVSLDTLQDLLVGWAAVGAAVEPRLTVDVEDETGVTDAAGRQNAFFEELGVLVPAENQRHELTANGAALARALAADDEEQAREVAYALLADWPLTDELRGIVRDNPLPPDAIRPLVAALADENPDDSRVRTGAATLLALLAWAGHLDRDQQGRYCLPGATGPRGVPEGLEPAVEPAPEPAGEPAEPTEAAAEGPRGVPSEGLEPAVRRAEPVSAVTRIEEAGEGVEEAGEGVEEAGEGVEEAGEAGEAKPGPGRVSPTAGHAVETASHLPAGTAPITPDAIERGTRPAAGAEAAGEREPGEPGAEAEVEMGEETEAETAAGAGAGGLQISLEAEPEVDIRSDENGGLVIEIGAEPEDLSIGSADGLSISTVGGEAEEEDGGAEREEEGGQPEVGGKAAEDGREEVGAAEQEETPEGAETGAEEAGAAAGGEQAEGESGERAEAAEAGAGAGDETEAEAEAETESGGAAAAEADGEEAPEGAGAEAETAPSDGAGASDKRVLHTARPGEDTLGVALDLNLDADPDQIESLVRGLKHGLTED